MPNLLCPHCRHTIHISASMSGGTAFCPVCGKEFSVPVFPHEQVMNEFRNNETGCQVGRSNRGLAITGLILSCCCSLPGLIISIIALCNMKRENNYDGQGFAIAGIVISIILMGLSVLSSALQGLFMTEM